MFNKGKEVTVLVVVPACAACKINEAEIDMQKGTRHEGDPKFLLCLSCAGEVLASITDIERGRM
jgi:protein-arginine kinase activator protein McsA